LARTVTRRAERNVCGLLDKEKINKYSLMYLNRLSDLLFVISRLMNDNGQKDVLWKPGQYQ
jgi:cob(I)alamin adenosyltransferase